MYPPPASSYGPAYGQPGYNGHAADPRSAPYGAPPTDPHYGAPPQYDSRQAPPAYDTRAPPSHEAPPPQPAPSHDPYAAHYQHYQGHPPPAGYEHSQPPASAGYPPPAGGSYPPPAASAYGAPPASSAYGAPPAGYPPPDYAHAPGYSQAPPPHEAHHGAPPPADPHYAAHYGHAYGAPPPAYGAPPPGYPPPHGYGAPPPYGYPPPGYGPPPPGYGAPPGYAGRGMSPRRGQSPRRDRGRNDRDQGRGGDRKQGGGKGDGKSKNRDQGNKGGGQQKKEKQQKEEGHTSNDPADPKNRVTKWLEKHPGWMAVWLEGIDPPRRQASSPNVTALMVANFKIPKDGPAEFGFLCSKNSEGAKKKDREKDCTKDLIGDFDLLPIEDMKAWCQMPDTKTKLDLAPSDLDNLTKSIRAKFPRVTVELPEPSAFVLVGAQSWGPHEKAHGAEAELAMLEKFDPGFAELLREARRVGGMVRKQWFVACVTAKPDAKDDLRPVNVGFGFATDRNLARVRAVHAAEVRTQILTDDMFKKDTPQKAVPEVAPP